MGVIKVLTVVFVSLHAFVDGCFYRAKMDAVVLELFHILAEFIMTQNLQYLNGGIWGGGETQRTFPPVCKTTRSRELPAT